MALIKCPECSTEVSDKAAACPKCACPLHATAPPVVGQVTVEKTSKELKTHYLLALLVIGIGSAVTCTSAASDDQRAYGMLILFAGIVGMVVTKARRWWHHD
jgi:hypothetical protein